MGWFAEPPAPAPAPADNRTFRQKLEDFRAIRATMTPEARQREQESIGRERTEIQHRRWTCDSCGAICQRFSLFDMRGGIDFITFCQCPHPDGQEWHHLTLCSCCRLKVSCSCQHWV